MDQLICPSLSHIHYWYEEGMHVESAKHHSNKEQALPSDRLKRLNGIISTVLKVVLVTGVTFSGFTMDQLLCASLFPHPLFLVVCNGHV